MYRDGEDEVVDALSFRTDKSTPLASVIAHSCEPRKFVHLETRCGLAHNEVLANVFRTARWGAGSQLVVGVAERSLQPVFEHAGGDSATDVRQRRTARHRSWIIL